MTEQRISWFFERDTEKSLNLNPQYQRNPVWSMKNKKYLIDLIAEISGLEHQYRQRDFSPSNFSNTSRLGLKNMVGNVSEPLISFSSYDPMITPPLESRIHTLIFEGLFYSKRPSIVSAVDYKDAHRFIEGNGFH